MGAPLDALLACMTYNVHRLWHDLRTVVRRGVVMPAMLAWCRLVEVLLRGLLSRVETMKA